MGDRELLQLQHRYPGVAVWQDEASGRWGAAVHDGPVWADSPAELEEQIKAVNV